jgi:hypothetical protein
MAADSSSPKRPDMRSAGREGEPTEPRIPERFGIVAIDRHVKDDGRKLLLYTRTDHASQ